MQEIKNFIHKDTNLSRSGIHLCMKRDFEGAMKTDVESSLAIVCVCKNNLGEII